jgi:hypothetical protein
MPLAHDLLSQARILATLDATRPKQASLRRAISTAYYALFHLLVAACVQRVTPSGVAELGPRIARALVHWEMKDACLPISRNNPGSILLTLLPSALSPELRRVAKTFVELQEARHRADYDLSATYTRVDTVEYLNQTASAFEDWKHIQNNDEAKVFLSALMFAKRWSK